MSAAQLAELAALERERRQLARCIAVFDREINREKNVLAYLAARMRRLRHGQRDRS